MSLISWDSPEMNAIMEDWRKQFISQIKKMQADSPEVYYGVLYPDVRKVCDELLMEDDAANSS